MFHASTCPRIVQHFFKKAKYSSKDMLKSPVSKLVKKNEKFGAELEKTIVSKKDGSSHHVTDVFFNELSKQASHRHTFDHLHNLKDKKGKTVAVGVVSQDLGEQGLDNGFNLLETALPPFETLQELHKAIQLDISTTQKALQAEDAFAINLSIHPLAPRDMKTYKKFVVPKGVYDFLWQRGWDHSAGIDARAQNSPSTQVAVSQAADALTVIIGASAANIALFANSPFEEGKISQYKENRLMMWERMMSGSTVAGDRRLIRFPDKPFQNLAQYFQWMFGGDSGIYFVMPSQSAVGYKNAKDDIMIVDGNPPVLDYLDGKTWKARNLSEIITGTAIKAYEVSPEIAHMEVLQFAQFEAGGRIRYSLKKDGFPVAEFVAACKETSQMKVEEIFEAHAHFMYIEGRAPGSNLPDRELYAAGKEIALSVATSPSALQAGLIRNLDKTKKYIEHFPWGQLSKLRDVAIEQGLDGVVEDLSVYTFTQRILDLAAEGLSTEEQTFLAYPQWVLQQKQNGADRALAFVNEKQKTMSLERALRELIQLREVVIS